MSQDATESLYEDDENQLFGLGDSRSNKRRRSSEHESDVSEGHGNESEDDNNRNTVQMNCQLPYHKKVNKICGQ